MGAETNFQTFNTAFGLVPRFYYWIVDDTNNVWETGVGYLSASTTLVRETVLDNSSGTQTALTLSAGTKDVFCAPPENGVLVDTPYSNKAAELSGHVLNSHITLAVTASRVHYFPYLVRSGRKFTKIACEVSTAGGGGTLGRMALYNVLTTGLPGAKIAETATFAVDSTGTKLVSITLPASVAGWYWIAFISDGTPTMRGRANISRLESIFSNQVTFQSAGAGRQNTGSGTVLPDPAADTVVFTTEISMGLAP